MTTVSSSTPKAAPTTSPLTAPDVRRLDTLDARVERTETLKNGDTGAAVKALQNTLSELGFNSGETNGTFDAKLRGTLKNFQEAMGIASTGAVDKDTVQALRTALERQRSMPNAVRRGQKGDDVAEVERKLARLGYDVGEKDGIADAQLGTAIVAFKEDQAEFDNRAPLLSLKGLSVLDKESAALNHVSFRGRRELSMQQHRFDEVLGELSRRKNNDGTVGLGEGSARPAIGQLQQRLKAAGFDPKRTDGVFDERTAGALKIFQRKNDLEATGRLDPATWKALRKSIIDTDTAAAPVQKLGERSQEVRKTETLLKKAGFNPGTIDGIFDKKTAAAVRAFERQNKKPVNGEVGEKDLANLKKLASNPFKAPPENYKEIAWRGVHVSVRTATLVDQAEKWAAQHGVKPGWPMFQGSHSHVSESANTHAGGGAIDVNTEGRSDREVRIMVEALRRAGFAAWHRPAGGVSPEDHIHAIAIGDRDLASVARDQVREYFAGGDGLVGSAPDPHRNSIGRPIPKWAERFR